MSKNSAAEVNRRRLRVRQLLRLRATPEQIMAQLRAEKFKISRATLTRDLEALRGEDRRWLEGLSLGEFVSEYRHVIESKQEQVRQLQLIRANAKADHDKIDATRAINETELDIANLLAYGPTVLGTRMARQERSAEREREAV